MQSVDLIFHKGNQWRYHQGEPRKAQGWKLITEGLSPSSGHQNQGIAFGDHLGDYLLLEREKLVEPEICLKLVKHGPIVAR